MTLSDVGIFAVYAFAMGFIAGLGLGVVLRVMRFFSTP